MKSRLAKLEWELEATRDEMRRLRADVEAGTRLPAYWPFGSALDRALFFAYFVTTAVYLFFAALGLGWI